MTKKTDLLAINGAPSSATNYLEVVAQERLEPALVYRGDLLAHAMRQFGAKAISAADPSEPFQLTLPLYIGVTTPRATNEVPHIHQDQAEVYLVMQGEAEVLAKHRWRDGDWKKRIAGAGDMVVIQPEVCHWFNWRSVEGLAYVFKAPQRAGVGRWPAGKLTCTTGCPHFNNGCVLPDRSDPFLTLEKLR